MESEPSLDALEVHTEIARGLRSLQQGRGLDGETVMAQLIAELDAADDAGSVELR